MARILADLPDEDIKWLDSLAAESGRSRAAILREAVSSFRAEQLVKPGWADRFHDAMKKKKAESGK